MNKEQQELLDEAYKNYLKKYEPSKTPGIVNYSDPLQYRPFTQEEFINKIKTDDEFANKWGLKIEERELSLRERSFIVGSNHNEVSQNIKAFVGFDEDHTLHKHLDEINIPTKIVTLTYNDKTIESYES
jgi:hypothetical protein